MQTLDDLYFHFGIRYLTDSLPTVREYDFDAYFDDERIERGINLAERYKPEVEVDRPANKYDLKKWHNNPHRVFAYDDLEFHKDFDSVLVGKQMYEYIFFASDRYAEIKSDMRTDIDIGDYFRCETNNWMQYSIDSLNILPLLDAKEYTNYNWENIRLNCIIAPLKGERYFFDSITTLLTDTLNGNYGTLLRFRDRIFDVDTFFVNGNCGLYTLTQKEIIPAVYDSLIMDDAYIHAFDGRTMIIFDYMGNVVKDNIKRAYPVIYRYRVLDNNNRVYWLNRNGQEHDTYQYSIMSVDDQISSVPFDVVLTPPEKGIK